MRLLRSSVLVGLLILVSLPLGGAVAAPSSDSDLLMPRYFPETGYWVQGLFREYWETHGGLFVHGYPISRVFEQDGVQRQYFERSVFEWHPEFSGTQYEVLLTRVGADRTQHRLDEQPFLPLAPFENSEDHVYYTETGHSLNYGFKTFWNKFGGLQNFGYPLSEEFDERNQPPPAGDGEVHTVQYFERARFEYHPEYRGTDYEVLLGLLGREYLNERGAPEWAVTPEDPQLPSRDVTTNSLHGPHVGYGFNIFWRGDDQSAEFHAATLDKVQEAGFSWVRLQVQWSEIERSPGEYSPWPMDRIVDAAHERGLKVLASVVKAPSWVEPNGGIPEDATSFGNLMNFLADRYQGKVHAWEIWNEQNLAHETGGYVRYERYVGLLKAGYNGVKAAAPDAIVVFGGLTPNGVNDPTIAIDDVQYLNQIYDYNGGEIKNYFDVLGAHPGSNQNPPDTMWPNNPGPGPGWQDHASFYFRRIEQLRQVMIDKGDADKQIWLTEFGWTTENQAPGYEYGAQNSEEEQAQYLVRSFEIGKQEWPWIGLMSVWNLNYSLIAPPSDEKYPWSVLNSDWSPRPSFNALKEMPK